MFRDVQLQFSNGALGLFPDERLLSCRWQDLNWLDLREAELVTTRNNQRAQVPAQQDLPAAGGAEPILQQLQAAQNRIQQLEAAAAAAAAPVQ